MKSFKGKTLRWEWSEGVIELTLDHAPANEIGTAMLAELEKIRGSFQCDGAGDFRLHYCERAEVRFFRWRRFARTVCDRGGSSRKRTSRGRARFSGTRPRRPERHRCRALCYHRCSSWRLSWWMT